MKAQPDEPNPGIPLGGAGAGGFHLGPDGILRGVCLGRPLALCGPMREHAGTGAFLRVEAGTRIYARRFAAGADWGALEALAPDAIAARMAYPCAHLRLADPARPVELTWTAFSPVLPFDHEASTLPLACMSFLLSNPEKQPIHVTAGMSWRNPDPDPRRPAPRPIAVTLDRTRQGNAPEGPNALLFPGADGGHQCLAAYTEGETSMQFAAFDGADLAWTWSAFAESGALPSSEADAAAAGAALAGFTLAPGATRRIDFALAWFPEEDRPGAAAWPYRRRFKDAPAVCGHGLTHVAFFYKAVEGWRKRILESSLPTWLGEALIDSVSLFATHGQLRPDGGLSLIENAERPRIGRLDGRLSDSLGMLLFFPRFEELELRALVRHCAPGRDAGEAFALPRCCRDLGAGAAPEPHWEEAEARAIERVSLLALSAWRDSEWSGKLSLRMGLLPGLRELMAPLAARAEAADGLPDAGIPHEGGAALSRGGLNAYSGGLWLAALRAHAELARRQACHADAERFAALLERAVRAYEARFWNEEDGHYQWLPAGAPGGLAATCHAAQLAGPWCAALFGFGALLPPARVARALDTVRRRCIEGGVFRVAAPPEGREDRWDDGAHADLAAPALLQCAGLLMRGGAPGEGLALLRAHWPRVRDNSSSGSAGLMLWHALFDLSGCVLDVPSERLLLRPRPLSETGPTRLPLLTPAALGRLRIQPASASAKDCQVRVVFDSPVRIRELALELPGLAGPLQVQCEQGGAALPLRFETAFGPEGVRILLHAAEPWTLDQPLDIFVHQTGSGGGA